MWSTADINRNKYTKKTWKYHAEYVDNDTNCK
jgi:hypothetical protein